MCTVFRLSLRQTEKEKGRSILFNNNPLYLSIYFRKNENKNSFQKISTISFVLSFIVVSTVSRKKKKHLLVCYSILFLVSQFLFFPLISHLRQTPATVMFVFFKQTVEKGRKVRVCLTIIFRFSC